MTQVGEKIKNDVPDEGSLIAIIKKRLSNRPDSEHEMTLNRIVMNSITILYAYIIDLSGVDPQQSYLQILAPYYTSYAVATVALFACIVWKPQESAIRRGIAIIIDVAIVGVAIHLGNEWYLWLYPFLLWVIFGNGFRFGNRYLVAASVASILTFSLLMQYSHFWHRYPALSWGCLIGLIALPGYVSVLIRKLSNAKKQAEESNKAKSAFLASISHELRTPLTAVIGLSELLGKTNLSNEQKEMTQTIRDSGQALISMINAILDLSRLEAGKMPKVAETFDIFRVLHQIADMASVAARAKGVRLALNIGNDVPRVVFSSRKHIEDSVMNLVSNAVKFTSSGHVVLRASVLDANRNARRIRIEVIDSGIGIAAEALTRIFERFTQADDTIVNNYGGTGLGLATVRQMIEDIGGVVGVSSTPGVGSRFWIDFDVTETESLATGEWKCVPIVAITEDLELLQMLESLELDLRSFATGELAIVEIEAIRNCDRVEPVVFVDGRVCRSDFGTIAQVLFTSESGHRARLVAVAESVDELGVVVPAQDYVTAISRPIELNRLANALVVATGPKPLDSDVAKVNTISTADKSVTVLLADDNRVNRLVVGMVLKQAGHTVIEAENGQIALQRLLDNAVDIALFDINMPVLDGIEATKLYRFSSPQGATLPIVALTADATPETAERCRAAGMQGCLTKPIDPALLLREIGKLVQMSDRRVLSDHHAVELENGPIDALPVSDICGEEKCLISISTLDDLTALGGAEFARSVVENFVEETQSVLEGLDDALNNLDVKAFRDMLHALRSGAANVGAAKAYKLCLQWRNIEAAELVENGDSYLKELSSVLVASCNQLSEHCLKSVGAIEKEIVHGQSFPSKKAS